ncbi:MAG: recombinase zinc beta ribbon domain-containing protein [Anaerolineales bacterium]|nr:recombinase zinc beta ribbon domain-containing protein [Anaerolineales bacterium]
MRQWYFTTVKRILKSRVYVGFLHGWGATIRDKRLAIVHLGTWEAAQARLANNRREHSNGRKREYLLTGFIECACGHRMHGCHIKPKGTKTYLYYQCSAVSHRESDCRESVLPLTKVDGIVWGWIMEILCDDKRREEGLREYAGRRARDEKSSR